MRYLIALFLITSFLVKGKCQSTITQAKGICISELCLCQTSLSSLKGAFGEFSRVDVEEMDLPKNCYQHDGRFTNGEGWTTSKLPGLIFQVGNERDFIGKIRLTSDFNGALPDGKTIDLRTLKLIDLFRLYPEFKDKWNSRGCSEYWRFSNDTIAFYVRIDKSIQPQFPINESYYGDKSVVAADIVISCRSVLGKSKPLLLSDGNEPLMFLDSIQVNKGVMQTLDPSDIAFVTVLKDQNAIQIAGKEARNGVIYFTTKDFARKKYWTYFKSKSGAYKRLVTDMDKEKSVTYVLNGTQLEGGDYKQELFEIDDESFKGIDVDELKSGKGDKNESKPIVVKIRTHKK